MPTIGRLMRCRGGCGRGDIPLSKVGGCETLSDITALTLGPCRPMRPEGQVTPSVLAGGMLREPLFWRASERVKLLSGRGGANLRTCYSVNLLSSSLSVAYVTLTDTTCTVMPVGSVEAARFVGLAR